MAFGTEKQVYTGTRTIDQAEFDAGLRAHMLRVYNYMASGSALTGIFAIVIAQLSVVTNDAGQIVAPTVFCNTLFGSPFKWVVMLAPLGMVFFLSARLHRMSQSTAQITFWVYAAMMGIPVGDNLYRLHRRQRRPRVLHHRRHLRRNEPLGYTTKKDLSGWGSFLFMG